MDSYVYLLICNLYVTLLLYILQKAYLFTLIVKNCTNWYLQLFCNILPFLEYRFALKNFNTCFTDTAILHFTDVYSEVLPNNII